MTDMVLEGLVFRTSIDARGSDRDASPADPCRAISMAEAKVPRGHHEEVARHDPPPTHTHTYTHNLYTGSLAHLA